MLVNNAGIRRDNVMFMMANEEWHDVLNTNLNQDTTHLIADAAYLQKYSTLLGLDSFADWQYPDWRAAVRDFGVAAYSETAQLYLTANCRYGITLSAASMTPQDYADLDALYAEGDTP